MKILLTGASGNFGQEFVRQSTDEVVAVNRDDWGRLDELMSGVGTIVHAASDLHRPVSMQPSAWIQSNIASTGTILEAAARHGAQRFVFTSSCAIYGDSSKTNEDCECAPISINGIGKLLNEQLISNFCEKNHIEFNILRVFNMYGGEDKFSIISRVRRALVEDTPIVLNNDGMAQRDFVHVRDVVSLTRKILDIHPAQSTMNIGTGRSTRIAKVIELVRQRFPDMKIENSQVEEAEYSRADIRQLKKIVDFKFTSVEQFLREEFSV